MQRMCIARYIISPCLLGCRWMVHFLKPAFYNRTSAQSNLTAGRIAAAHGRFNGICKMCTPQKHASLCRPESKSQTTASRSVQPFLHSSRQTVVILHNGPPFPLPYNCPFLRVIWTNPHLIHSSLGPPKSPTQRTSRLVQAFCTVHSTVSLYFTTGIPFPLWIAHSHGRSAPPSNAWFLGLTRVLNPNSISIGSAVFAGLATVTYRQSGHATLSVTIGRNYVRSIYGAA